MFNNISIIGCGLIGSSIFRALIKHNLTKKISIYDKSKDVLSFLKKENFSIDIFSDIKESVKNSDLVFIAVPLSSYKEVLLITGKGLHSNTDNNTYVSKELSKLKFAVPEYIKTQKDLSDKIISIEPALNNEGGEGAIIIKLRKL